MATDEQRDEIGRFFARLNAMSEDEAERFFARYGLASRVAQEAQLARWWEAATPEARQAFQASFAPASGEHLTRLATGRGETRELRQEGDPDAAFDPVLGVWAESDDALRRRLLRTLARDGAGEGEHAG
jgi:phage-related baseplate assembly protein